MSAPRRSWVAIVSLVVLVAAGLGAVPRPAAAGGTSLTMTVTLSGNGSGYYTADGGIHCVRNGGITSGTCKLTYDLSGGAIPWGNAYGADPGSCFVVGSACQEGALGLAGYLYPGPDQFVSMEFRLLDPVTITVKKSGTGSGTVKSTPRGINCGSDCKSDYAKSSSFTVKATPKSGSKFTKWTAGPCQAQGSTCTFTVGAGPITLTAIFTKTVMATPTPELTEPPVTPEPTPEPTPGPTPVVPTPFKIVTAAPSTAGPAATSGPPVAPAADEGGRSTLILALSSLLVIILAAGGLYAMRTRRTSTATSSGPAAPPSGPPPGGPPAP